jgi:hypothetical protein
MAGEANCQWAAWFKSHHTDYAKMPGSSQLAVWTVEHTKMLDEVAKERTDLGETVYREKQNKFRATRASGLAISGTPDIITFNSASGRYTIYDIKTGNPRQSDIIQVALYMMFLPYATGLYKGKNLEGCVVYKTGRSDVPHQIIDNKFKKHVSYFLDLLESNIQPAKLPSHSGCLWCDLTIEDCPERIHRKDDDSAEYYRESPS